jgi:hypothetical protein
MTIAQAIAKSVETLPPDKQQEVMDFAEFLRSSAQKRPRRTARVLEGIWDGMGIKPITEEDIRQARREMWSNFPREFPK